MIRSSMRRYHTYPPHRAPVGALCGPVGTHRAPIGAICEGSSMHDYISYLLVLCVLNKIIHF